MCTITYQHFSRFFSRRHQWRIQTSSLGGSQTGGRQKSSFV